MMVYMQIVVGPVIGKVTRTTARILVEASEQCDVTLTLIPPAPAFALFSKVKPEVIPKAELSQAVGKRPVIFNFSSLSCKTTYTVQVRLSLSSTVTLYES